MEAGAGDRATGRSVRRAIAAGSIGNFVEWYDFAIYGYSAVIIATLFFPEGDRTTALLATFAIFGVAFLARPLGAVVFGHLGDRMGRRNTLSLVVLLMGLSTLLIGLLPTYGQVGILAPILLLICRLGQGFSAGGEYAGATSFIMEYAPSNRRGLWVGVAASAVFLGTIAGAVTVLLFPSLLPDGAYASWGWRVPFLIGGVLAVVGLYLRFRMEDTPAFRQLQHSGQVDRAPIVEAFRTHFRAMVLLFGASVLVGVTLYTLSTYFVAYLVENIGLSLSTALLSNALALCIPALLIPLGGLLSDKVGRKPVLLLGCVCLGVLSIPAYLVASSGGFVAAFLGQALLALGLVFFGPSINIISAELFPTRVRYSAYSVSYNAAYMLFGGTAPFVGTLLVARTGSTLAPAFYLLAVAVIALFFVLAMPETYRLPLLRGEEAGEPEQTDLHEKV